MIKPLGTTKAVGHYHGASLAWLKDMAQLDCSLAAFSMIAMGPRCSIEWNVIYIPLYTCPTRKRKQRCLQFRTRLVEVICFPYSPWKISNNTMIQIGRSPATLHQVKKPQWRTSNLNLEEVLINEGFRPFLVIYWLNII